MTFLAALKKVGLYDENWARGMYLNVCVCLEFLSCLYGKNEVFNFSGQTCVS